MDDRCVDAIFGPGCNDSQRKAGAPRQALRHSVSCPLYRRGGAGRTQSSRSSTAASHTRTISSKRSVAESLSWTTTTTDGWIFLSFAGRAWTQPVPDSSNRLYKNNRDGTFSDVTEKAGLLRTGWASGVTVGDYNNDGFEDIFITYYGQNVLYRNNGDGTFTDVTRQAGLLYEGNTRWGSGCTFLDYDRDGRLDLFVANYVDLQLERFPNPAPTRTATSKESRSTADRAGYPCLETTFTGTRVTERFAMYPRRAVSPRLNARTR